LKVIRFWINHESPKTEKKTLTVSYSIRAFVYLSTIGAATNNRVDYLLRPLHPILRCHSIGGVAGRGVDTSDVRRAPYRWWYALRGYSSRRARVEPADTRRHLGRPGPIQVHRKHLTCHVEGGHASCQRSAYIVQGGLK